MNDNNPLDIANILNGIKDLSYQNQNGSIDFSELSELFPKKRKWDKKHRYGKIVKCSNCGKGGTLYNINGKYYCTNCKKEVIS